MIGPGDMMFAAAHTPHGYDQFSEDFSVWVVFTCLSGVGLSHPGEIGLMPAVLTICDLPDLPGRSLKADLRTQAARRRVSIISPLVQPSAAGRQRFLQDA